jgi:hydroxymethylbilane synthase
MVNSMTGGNRSVVIATRGSALALAQAHQIKASCEAAFPGVVFELKVMKTTGDRLQTASLAQLTDSKGLFTKELEVALLEGQADLAVHSLKDLPTELPAGLQLLAVSARADVRDVLVYRGARRWSGELHEPVITPDTSRIPDSRELVPPVHEMAARPGERGMGPGRRFEASLRVEDLPASALVATSSTRRRSQLLAIRPDLKVVEIRGNVVTRLRKLMEQGELDATILAAAGLDRLRIRILPGGELVGEGVPDGFMASVLSVETMLPCVGQGALGIEARADDARALEICAKLDHGETHCCVLAERSFLRAMGGGCQSPVGALGRLEDGQLRLRAVSFQGGRMIAGELTGRSEAAEELGRELAARLAHDMA